MASKDTLFELLVLVTKLEHVLCVQYMEFTFIRLRLSLKWKIGSASVAALSRNRIAMYGGR